VIVERFGAPSQGELHFTLRNYSDRPVQSTLVPDWQGLSVPADAQWVYLDILPGTPLLAAFPREGCRLALEAEGSRALWVGTREQAAQHAFRMAAATLEKLERLFSTEMDEAGKAAWRKALQVARAGSRADGRHALTLLLADQLLRLGGMVGVHLIVDGSKNAQLTGVVQHLDDAQMAADEMLQPVPGRILGLRLGSRETALASSYSFSRSLAGICRTTAPDPGRCLARSVGPCTACRRSRCMVGWARRRAPPRSLPQWSHRLGNRC